MPTDGDSFQIAKDRSNERVPSIEAIRALSRQYEHFLEPAIQGYLNAAADRLSYTLQLLRSIQLDKPRVLEIGAFPYYMTMLMSEYLGYDVTALNEPCNDLPGTGASVLRKETGEEIIIPYASANIEYEPFPFESASFDLVIFAEVIEHLTYDPTHSLSEIHRVLKNGGYLVISTPNALRWEYLRRMVRGENFYPPYSGYGTTARHNREFSVDELRHLVAECGFTVETIEAVRDEAYDHPGYWDKAARMLNRLGFWKDRLDVIHLIARASGNRRMVYPEHLYYDLHAYRRISDPAVTVGVNDQLQIDHTGFYPIEDLPPNIRWTRQDAVVFVKGDGHASLRIRFYSGKRRRPATLSVSVNDAIVGSVRCPPDEWVETEFRLPSIIQGEASVTLHLDEMFVPAFESKTSSDSRELGVALEWIRLL